MSLIEDPFAQVQAVADAVLYEGYVLYPYRASSRKNQARWQFGVLMPPAFAAADPSERSANRTEVVFEANAGATLRVRVRFLQLQHRTGGGPDWDEGVERQIDVELPVDELRTNRAEHPFEVAAEQSTDGDVQRQTAALRGQLRLAATELPGPYGALRLRIDVANLTPADPPGRDEALRSALVGVHTLCALQPGRFVSMTDPPEWAAPYLADCTNEGTWPVLGGTPSVLLSSPIILADDPQIAPESPGDLYDATEIDEILTLRTMALTDAEKDEARATDPRAAAVIEQVDSLPPEQLDRLHGALRYLRTVQGAESGDGPIGAVPTPQVAAPPEPETIMTPDTPWWDPGADTSVSPATDAILVDGVPVARGSRVRLRPGRRRTDAQDEFLRGRTATVEAVLFDVDGGQHLGVLPDEDPELAEIQRWHGRFLYFTPDEVEPLTDVVPGSGP